MCPECPRKEWRTKSFGLQSTITVTLARPLHVSKVGQSKKGKTKYATLISDFHAHGSKSSLSPIRLLRRRHQQLPKRYRVFWVQSHTAAGLNNRGVPFHYTKGRQTPDRRPVPVCEEIVTVPCATKAKLVQKCLERLT